MGIFSFLNRSRNFEIPILVKNNHPFINLMVNTAPAYFLLDTGATGTVLAHERIAPFNKSGEEITLNADNKSTGIGGTVLGTLILLTLQIERVTIEDYAATVISMSKINAKYEENGLKPIDGVFGFDLLKRLNAIIDLKR